MVRQLQCRWRLLLATVGCVAASLCGCSAATDGTSNNRLTGFKPLSSDTHPSLLCIGAAKAGTTDLHKALTTLLPRHFNKPKGQMNDGKELLVLANKEFANNQSQPADYYSMLNRDGPAPFTLDFSPLYLWSEAAPQNAAKLLPGGTSVLVMLRDPVSHLISFINWRKGDNGNRHVKQLDAGEVLLTELQLLTQPRLYKQLMMAVFSKDAGQGHELYLELAAEVDRTLGELFGPRFTNRKQGYVTASIVLTGLRHWLDSFATPGRTLVVLSDAWFSNRTDVWANALMPFMFGDDEDRWPEIDSDWLSTSEPALKQEYAKKIPDELRCVLHTFYQPFVCQLEQLLRDHPAATVYPPGRLDGTCKPWGVASDVLAECRGLPSNYTSVFNRLQGGVLQKVAKRLRH